MAKRNTNGLAPVIESPVPAPAKATRERPCECGECGRMTQGTWAPGHDMKHRSVLLARFDGGDQAAGDELIRRAWYREDQLAEREMKRIAKAERAARREADRQARSAQRQADREAKAAAEAEWQAEATA